MAAELIGLCKCPLCGSTKAKLTLAKSGLPVLTCNGCNTQMFARSDRSDDLMRGLILAPREPAPAPPEPAPEPDHPEPRNPDNPQKPSWGIGAF